MATLWSALSCCSSAGVSANSELWALTPALLQQLRNDYEVATALCRKMGMQSCKELREAKEVVCVRKSLHAAELATLGTLGLVLPALEVLQALCQSAAGPDGVQRLAEGLGAGALPAVTVLSLGGTYVGDAGASAFAAALGHGALPRLNRLILSSTAIGDAGLVALAPALRLLPALLPIAGCCQRLRPQRRPLRSRTGARRRARDSAARCAGAQAALKVSVVCSAAQPAPRRLPPCKRHWQNRQPAHSHPSLLIVPPLACVLALSC